jgi:Na+/melibiose symporter-like transporter
MATLALSGWLGPGKVFAIAIVAGLVRPSENGMRGALIGETVPPAALVGAMGASRTTADSARIMGSLAGAGLAATFGVGPAYVGIALVYIAGLLLTLRTGAPRHTDHAPPAAFTRDLREGIAYVWNAPASLAALLLAALVNGTAFPLTSGLMPFVARDVYHVSQQGLGFLIASFAIGALLGSITVILAGRAIRPARMMLGFALAWYIILLVFVRTPSPTYGHIVLFAAGYAQSLSLVPLSVLLLHATDPQFRGRVMGLRMLAIYGLPIGLLVAGALIDNVGFVPAITLFCAAGILLTLAIGVYWRHSLWPRDAPANRR